MDCAGCDNCLFDMDSDDSSLGHFEIHITVRTDNVPWFRRVCRENKVKPLLIALQLDLEEDVETQVMTSQRLKGNLDDLCREVDRIHSVLSGFDILRTKVETSPETPKGLPAIYREAHLEVNRKKLRDFPELHLSANAFKADDKLRMATFRERGLTARQFTRRVLLLRKALELQGVEVSRVIVESVIWDTNEDLDNNWLKK